MSGVQQRAEELDAADPLAGFRDRFLPSPDVVAYLDGNSLGRPPVEAAQRLDRFVRGPWADRLIRGWTDEWMEWPTRLGDRIGEIALGAAPGQTVVADSTSVLLYKLARAAVDARAAADPQRREIVLHRDDFPTDRYLLEGIAAERGGTLRWISSDPATGVTPDQVADAVGPRTALVLLSHVSYRSGWIADAAAITDIAHRAGALVLWDLSHSVGSVPVTLDAWDADLAVGCTYKYLCGGPGSPAFGYIGAGRQGQLRQPIQGWMGERDPFTMGQGYRPGPGMRAVLSGTPPILAMVPLTAGLDLLAEATITAVRAKSVALTEFARQVIDDWPRELGVELVSPRDPRQRGGHLTVRRTGFRAVLDELWACGVLPDYREPDGIRIGPAPLSTGFVELHRGLDVLRGLLPGS